MTASGSLGLIGGGYGGADWLEREFVLAGGARVGCGFITWSLARAPELLDETLRRRPATIMLSFGALQPFAERIHVAGVPLTAQVQSLEHARQALEAGAEILVAQGGEAGGHGMTVRSTFTLVPDVVDLAAQRAPSTLVLAAGGIADGAWPRGCAGPRCRWRGGGHQVLGIPRGAGVSARMLGIFRPAATTPIALGSMTRSGAWTGRPNTTSER